MQSNVEVSQSRVRRALHVAGYYCRVAAKKPFLSDRHKRNRLDFARTLESWTVEDWKKVVWTDESTFELGKNSRQITVWRKTNERYNLDCLAPTFNSGHTSVTIWGAFTATGRALWFSCHQEGAQQQTLMISCMMPL